VLIEQDAKAKCCGGQAQNIEPRYNIAPTTMIDVVVPHDAGREFHQLKFAAIV
jgi:putative SOS response-associated peptidase YedK